MKNYFELKENGIQLKTTVPGTAIKKLKIDLTENDHVRGLIEVKIIKEYQQIALNASFGGDSITVLGEENNFIFRIG